MQRLKVFVETERLLLREMHPIDVDGMYEMDSDPLVHQYLGNKPIKSKEKVLEIIHYVRQQYKENGIGRWSIIEKSSNQFIGWTGLKLFTEAFNNHINFYDVGYRLLRKFWGKGYATESAIASLDYGFNIMDLDKIYGAAHVDNVASNKILTNLGMQYLETFQYEEEDCYWYVLKKENWETNLRQE